MKNIVKFEEIAENADFQSGKNTLAILGEDSNENALYLDIAEAVHVLIAGSTGSGKSCLMHSIISSLMMQNTNRSADFILIDPKRVEFFDYKNSDMLYKNKIIETTGEAKEALNEICEEIEARYEYLKLVGKRSIDELSNINIMKRKFIFIDELSFLMLDSKKEIETSISKIGMLGRACGVHLIVATQRPDRQTITGSIQANLNTIIGLTTRRAIDSRLIISSNKLTKLNGKGEAILLSGLNEKKFKSAYIDREFIQKIANNEEKTKNCQHEMKYNQFSFSFEKHMNIFS